MMFGRAVRRIKREPWLSSIQKEIKQTESDVFVRAIVFWKKCFMWFYNIQKVRLDAVDVKILKTLLESVDFDVRKMSLLMLSFFYEHKTKRYFLERGIIPMLPKLSKYRNEYLAKIRYIESAFSFYERFKTVFDFLGWHPLIRVENEIVPFGLDIPKEVREKGILWCDVVEINGMKVRAIDRVGQKVEFLGYAHFSEEVDAITGEIVRKDNDSIIYLRLGEITSFFLDYWYDKRFSLVEKRSVFDEIWKKKGSMNS